MKLIQFSRVLVSLLLFLSVSQLSYGQTDTLRLTLPQAEQQFLQKNFALLAQKYNINLSEAAVQQAKLWDNPNFQFGFNAFNPNTSKVLPLTNPSGDKLNPTGGAYSWQLQQVLSLAGRRSKLVALNEANTEVQQAVFQDVMRSLRYQLAQTFGTLASEQAQYAFIQEERTRLANLLDAFRAQLKLGVISEYEVTRLELEQRNTDAAINDLRNQISQDEATLRILLADTSSTYYRTEFQISDSASPLLNQLLDQAVANRPDLQTTQRQTTYAQQNLTYQKSLATPQLMVGANYARFGEAYPNYYGLQVAMDLPFKNRNQGNIQAAKIGIEQSTQNINQSQLQIRQEVISAYEQWQHAQQLQANLDPGYRQRIQDISKNATIDYQKRVIDLVSFIDKIRSYKDAQLNFINLSNQLYQAQQQLNYVTNSKTF
ncbi:TolC family protein [Siphonobacter curvatus]|uniref:TolC family protein n=1 Tax=Siphonobacter curvatus TaxID=2094562 RepID=A0A2S7ILA6_9BACT|nr:TolC family protein [Siphonobacter curvatus]